MKFEFTPSKNSTSFNEFIKYITETSLVNEIYKLCMGPILLFLLLGVFLFINDNEIIFISSIISNSIISISVIFISIMFFIAYKLSTRKKKKKANLKALVDGDSTIYFTIEDEYFIRENKYSTLKIALSEFIRIELLENTLVLLERNNQRVVFIPKDCLSVSLEEFLELFKNRNSSIIINDYFKSHKKQLKKRVVTIGSIFILVTLSSFLITKYNYENTFHKYDLVTGSELQKEENNNGYIYENNKLGLGVYFPDNWNGHYGIEELSDRINIYYLPKGVQSRKTTLICTITNQFDIDGSEKFNKIRSAGNSNGVYNFFVPKKIDTLIKDSKEYKEYSKMYYDIKELKIK